MGFHLRTEGQSRFLCTYDPSVAEKVVSQISSPQVGAVVNRLKGEIASLLRAAAKLIGTQDEIPTADNYRASILPQTVTLTEIFKDQTQKKAGILQGLLGPRRDYQVPDTELPEVVARLEFTTYLDRLLPDILISISSSSYWLAYGPKLGKIDHPDYFHRIQNSVANNTFHSVIHSPIDLYLSLSDLFWMEKSESYHDKAENILITWFSKRLKAMKQYDVGRRERMTKKR